MIFYSKFASFGILKIIVKYFYYFLSASRIILMLMKPIKSSGGIFQASVQWVAETSPGPSLNRSGVRGEGAQMSAAFIINTWWHLNRNVICSQNFIAVEHISLFIWNGQFLRLDISFQTGGKTLIHVHGLQTQAGLLDTFERWIFNRQRRRIGNVLLW